ncbi:HK97 gp10 family phage protein [Enterococcus faecium]|uniref:HK97 gp10 family phage protein n=1 Tax=Enterococcus faecium TaxID=1352 RepID=UPI0019213EB6|nr:HK97 gp10 family phage protein [Enterococcus faecium]EGP4894215.1 HK97 gp10 family phage protein [Enterococcus faecium]EHK9936771.1 HK97 gp10 family phage protein [Enterococcus faecium]MBL3708363.1 hypothetical protein [Enterococcus faecium]
MSNPFGGNIFGSIWECVNDHIEQRAKECQRIMKDTINEDTGALRDSVEIEKKSDGSYLVGVNERKLVLDKRNKRHENYVAYYYYGTKPHVIRAKKGKMLRFRGKDGKIHYKKQVHHPGTKPHNFIQQTLDKMR